MDGRRYWYSDSMPYSRAAGTTTFSRAHPCKAKQPSLSSGRLDTVGSDSTVARTVHRGAMIFMVWSEHTLASEMTAAAHLKAVHKGLVAVVKVQDRQAGTWPQDPRQL